MFNFIAVHRSTSFSCFQQSNKNSTGDHRWDVFSVYALPCSPFDLNVGSLMQSFLALRHFESQIILGLTDAKAEYLNRENGVKRHS